MLNSFHRVGGYECVFIDTPHNDDFCFVCLHPARNPLQTKCDCAKLFCKPCYERYKSTNEKCPTCDKNLDAFPDKCSARRVKELHVKCTSEHCPWINSLRLLENHLTECEFVIEPCTIDCGMLVMRRKQRVHCNEECTLRQHTCEHCGAIGTYEKMTGHLHKCPDLMVSCPNRGCKVRNMKQSTMTTNHRLECPYEMIDCPYKDVGCEYMSMRRRMDHHTSTSYGQHLDLTMVRLKRLEVFNDRYYCTPCVIQMAGFNQSKVNNTRWYSQPYIHSSGYKMCFIVDSNGNGGGRGTHLSVYLSLKKDATLMRPIGYKFTFSLLNQLRDEDHHTRTCIVSDDKAAESDAGRIEGDETYGIEKGDDQFIPQSQLGFQQDRQCHYLKDDSLYFRIHVQILPTCNSKPWLNVTLPSEVM